MTTSTPPGRSTSRAPSSACGRTSSSSLTAMRSAWNVRVAGWMARACPGSRTRARRPRRRRPAGRRCRWVRPGARGDDGARDPTRVRLLAVRPDEPRQGVLVEGRHELAGGDAGGGIEAHVQGSLGAEAEAPLAFGQLVGAQPEVQQDAVDLAEARVPGDLTEAPEVGVTEHEPIAVAGEPLPRALQRTRDRHRGQAPDHRGWRPPGSGGCALRRRRCRRYGSCPGSVRVPS